MDHPGLLQTIKNDLLELMRHHGELCLMTYLPAKINSNLLASK